MAGSERFDRPRFGAPLRRPFGVALRRLYLIAPLATLVALFVAGEWKGGALLTRGPMSPAHAGFGSECARCHSVPFRRIRFSDERGASRAMNADCLKCHGRTIGHSETTPTATHHERVSGDGLPCATCHREHEGT